MKVLGTSQNSGYRANLSLNKNHYRYIYPFNKKTKLLSFEAKFLTLKLVFKKKLSDEDLQLLTAVSDLLGNVMFSSLPFLSE